MTSIFHPRDGALQRFADSEASTREHSRVSSPLVGCPACPTKVSFLRELAARARSIDTPDPSPDLIGRVIAERREGQRMILPVSEPAEKSRRIVIPVTAAALA